MIDSPCLTSVTLGLVDKINIEPSVVERPTGRFTCVSGYKVCQNTRMASHCVLQLTLTFIEPQREILQKS